jgi:uncharacterized protein (DUF2141 family)
MHRFSLLAALVLPLAAQAADVTLEVTGLDTQRLEGSSLMVAVFTAPGQWLGQPELGRRFVVGPDATSGKLTVQLSGLPEGPIALSVFHDANGNGRLDANAMGLPVERYGFSNDAAGVYGPPKFEQAVLTPVAGTPVRIQLN